MIIIKDTLNFLNPLKVIKSYISASTFNWVAAAATLIASNQQKQAAKRAAGAQTEAARIAAEGAKFDPYNVSGMFGTGTFDPITNQASTQLSPEMQQYAATLQQQAGGFLGQGQTQLGAQATQLGGQFLGAMQVDPFQAAQTQFGRMEEILAPSRQRQREALESRLLRQGRLGGTGGALQQQSLESAIEESRQRGLFSALEQAQGIQRQQADIGRQLGAFGQAQEDVGFGKFQERMRALQGLDTQTQRMLELGAGFGGRAAQAGQAVGAFGMQGARAQGMQMLGEGAGKAAGIQQLGNAFSGYLSRGGGGGVQGNSYQVQSSDTGDLGW